MTRFCFCLDSTVQVLSISFPLQLAVAAVAAVGATRVKANLDRRVVLPPPRYMDVVGGGGELRGGLDGFRASQPWVQKLDGRLAKSIFDRLNLSFSLSVKWMQGWEEIAEGKRSLRE